MSSTSKPANLLSSEPGKDLLVKLCKVMSRKLDAALEEPSIEVEEPDPETGELVLVTKPNPAFLPMTAAEMASIIKLLSDNSVTLASIQRGEFGEVAKRAEEEYPFPAGAQIEGARVQ